MSPHPQDSSPHRRARDESCTGCRHPLTSSCTDLYHNYEARANPVFRSDRTDVCGSDVSHVQGLLQCAELIEGKTSVVVSGVRISTLRGFGCAVVFTVSLFLRFLLVR
jgi:hypothetical protein